MDFKAVKCQSEPLPSGRRRLEVHIYGWMIASVRNDLDKAVHSLLRSLDCRPDVKNHWGHRMFGGSRSLSTGTNLKSPRVLYIEIDDSEAPQGSISLEELVESFFAHIEAPKGWQHLVDYAA